MIPGTTTKQKTAIARLSARCSVRGVIPYSTGEVQVGFETIQGRDREALIAPDGSRLRTWNTYEYH